MYSRIQQKLSSQILLITTCLVVSPLSPLSSLSSDSSINASTTNTSSSSSIQPLSLSDPSSLPPAVTIPEAQTCKKCFADVLTSEEIDRLETSLDDTLANASLDGICAELELEVGDNPVGDWVTILHAAGVADQEKVDSLIQCLKEAGIVFEIGG